MASTSSTSDMASRTIKTRILIVSDTHCASLTKSNSTFKFPCPPFEAPLPAADLLIHCGDLTHSGEQGEYQAALEMLKTISAPVKLVIAGNHDLSLDREFVFSHLGRGGGASSGKLGVEEAERKVRGARDVWTAEDGRARREGVTFLDEGLHQIDLVNGARVKVYASPYTPEFCDWGFPYERDEDRFNSPSTSLSDAKNIAQNPVPSFSQTDRSRNIDIMITHGPPYEILDQTTRGDLAGCPHLLRAVTRARPLLHCFGHIHEGWGAKVMKWAEGVEQVMGKGPSMWDWKKGGWKAGVAEDGVEDVEADLDEARERHAAYLDLSSGGRDLARGRETAMVNAAVMNVRYEPTNAPWLIDVDLPQGAADD